MPLSTASPAALAISALGMTPMQISTRSAGRCRPSEVSTPDTRPPAPRIRVTPAPVRIGKELGDRRRHHPAHRLLRHLDDADGGAPCDRHRGKFEPDKPGADNDDVAR